MSIENIQTLVNNSDEGFDLVSNAFTFGYIQGMKAQKAKDKKKKAWSYLFYSLVGARLWKEYANTSIWLLNYQKRNLAYKRNISQRKNYHIKYYHSWGSIRSTSFFYMSGVVFCDLRALICLHPFYMSKVIELVTLYICVLVLGTLNWLIFERVNI